MKKRVSIYIDDLVWENVKEHAWKVRKSASQYLEDILDGDVSVIPTKESGRTLIKREVVEAVIEDEDKKLIEKRKKIADLKSSLTENDRHQSIQMNPQPKAKWKGAK